LTSQSLLLLNPNCQLPSVICLSQIVAEP
jgi:hypothetical protein